MTRKHRLSVPLSVLDATVMGPGVSPVQAMQWTREVAMMADRWDFLRLWVVEHHSVPDIGCSRPAVLISHLASVTQRLRIGAGGVMLPNHSALAVAEEFSLLSALFPDRIDLGLGRAGSHHVATNQALGRRSDDLATFETQLDELFGFLGRGFPEGHPYREVSIPLQTSAPPTYLLGSSPSSASFAAQHGLPFAYAHHLNPTSTVTSLATYRKEFQPQTPTSPPYTLITVAVICASTPQQAEEAAFRSMIPKIRRGLAIQHGLRVRDEVLLHPEWSPGEMEAVRGELSKGWILCGDPDQIMEGLEHLASSTGADEIMLTAIEHNGPDRLRTLELVAAACLSPSLV